jgi:hydrogenase 3 maturation protease
VALSCKGKRIAILGIGNELDGDDAAGVLVARELKVVLAARPVSDVLIIDAGPVPENFSGTLRRFQPEVVIFVDAAELARPAGTYAWVDRNAIEGFGGSTHLLPLSVFAEYLVYEFHCQVAFVGIQPARINFDAGVSPVVLKTVHEVAQELLTMLVG